MSARNHQSFLLMRIMTPEHCRAARALLDWSQDQLADTARVGRQTVVDFERGVRSPKQKSFAAMQTALETHGIQFIPSSGEALGVLLRCSVWQLAPVDLASDNWKASTYKGEIIVRAPSERRAREIATLACTIARARLPTGRPALNPWNRMTGEATCERLNERYLLESGSEAILSPAHLDDEWRR
jgi:DNA-binding XRE family transcriptional regulator